jgi:hypothetical protein
MRQIKKQLETDMKQLRQQVTQGVSNSSEDISRIEMDSLRRNLA